MSIKSVHAKVLLLQENTIALDYYTFPFFVHLFISCIFCFCLCQVKCFFIFIIECVFVEIFIM